MATTSESLPASNGAATMPSAEAQVSEVADKLNVMQVNEGGSAGGAKATQEGGEGASAPEGDSGASSAQQNGLGATQTHGAQSAGQAASSNGGGSGANQQHTSASLYVGDLHPDITENNLYEIFQAVGPVQSIRVCRDVVTRRSLGYAYINFHNVVDAERALDTMNYYSSPLTKDKALRIMWKIRDPSVRKTGAGNIFVKSLDKSIDNKSLYDTFSQFGNILSCKVAMDENTHESLGYGFVHFETPEAAAAATEKVNGMLLAGRKVYVGKFLNKREREAAGQVNKAFTNVYVKNLDESVCTEDKLRDLFKDYGDMTSVHVPTDADGRPKGFAFVNFADPAMAARCASEMDGKEIEGKSIFVGRAQKRSERENELRTKYEQLKMERMQKYQGVNLYVKNLSDDIDDDRLRQEFSPFGTITSCKIMRDDKGYSRGFGFVCFTQPEEATKAVTELNGRMIGQKPVYVALAQRKDVRRAQLEAQRAANMRMPTGAIPATGIYAQPNPYMYQHPMPQMAQGPGMSPGRGGAYMSPQYGMAMGGRGGPGGRGAPMNSPYMGQMNRGQPGMNTGMNPAMMQAYVMPTQRQPRPGRQRGGHMGPGPANAQGMPGGRGGANGPGGRGRGGSNGNMGGQQFNYTPNARNAIMTNGVSQSQQQVHPGAGGGQQGGHGRQEAAPQASPPLTIEMLTSANPAQQKQMLGEKLYPLIVEHQPDLAGKITGMLLEMENPDILHLLESPDALTEQVDEALQVLRAHAASSPAEQGQPQAV